MVVVLVILSSLALKCDSLNVICFLEAFSMSSLLYDVLDEVIFLFLKQNNYIEEENVKDIQTS